MRLFDCVTYFNEEVMLDFRIKYLSDVVDIFVVVESAFTFSGDRKVFSARNVVNKLPPSMSKKVRIIEVNEAPPGQFCNHCDWQREYYQRNAIMRGLPDLESIDLVSICDVDEIPDVNKLAAVFGSMPLSWSGINMCMDMFYYSARNHMHQHGSSVKWLFPKLVRPSHLISPQEVRMSPQLFRATEPMGWHLSYMGDNDVLKYKIQSYAHQENNSTQILENLSVMRALRKDPFGRDYYFLDYNRSKLPALLQDRQYESYFFP
jgi:beta-1,4-mannosyl-glycoprotein beta-1,4-N-acetylglucosaminyltransferase